MAESLPENEDIGLTAPGETAPGETAPPDSEPVLTGEERDYFARAIEIGNESRTDTIYGHTVTVRTMTMAEELAVGQHIKPFLGTSSQAQAYRAAVVAATITDIDGVPLYTPVRKMSPAEIVEAKWNALQDYYPAFINAVYKVVQAMEKDVAQLLEKLGKSEG